MDSKLFTIPEAGPQSIAMQNLDRNAAGDRAWRLPPEDMAPPRTACDRITRAWSPSRTLGSLCSGGRGHIAALDGIRAMACVWVVADHCAQALYGGADGLEDAWRSTPSAWLVLNGELAVDVFFVLSGFLVFRILAQYLSSIEDGGDGLTASHAWFRFMSRRWLRIFPAYVVAAAIYTPRSASCRRGGVIWNLLFVNNVLGDQDCMGHTWSIAAEMQMYAFSPAVVMAMLSTRSALLVPAVFTALHIAITAVSMFLIAGPGAHYDPARTGTVFDNVHIKDMYDKPYTRCAPYVMGMAAAAWLHFHTPWRLHNSRESQGNDVEDESEATGLAVAYSPVTVDETLDVKEVAGGHMGGESTGAGGENGVNCTLGVLATVVFLAAAVVGTGYGYGPNFDDRPVIKWCLMLLTRPIIGMCTAYLCFASALSPRSPISAACSSRVWTWLARLSYSIYLLHLSFVGTEFSCEVVSCQLGLQDSLGDVWIRWAKVTALTLTTTSAAACVVYVCVEKPIMGLR